MTGQTKAQTQAAVTTHEYPDPHALRRGGLLRCGASGSGCARMRAGAATGRSASQRRRGSQQPQGCAASPNRQPHGGHQQPTGCEGSPEGKHPPMTTSGPTDAPSYREEMRERSGSHGRRRYALRQGQRLPAAGPAQPEPQNQPRQQSSPVRLGNGATDPAQAPGFLLATLATLRPCAQLPGGTAPNRGRQAHGGTAFPVKFAPVT